MRQNARSSLPKPLIHLARLSNFYGRDPDYVLAGGGNTSVKIGRRLYIKGSGTELARIRPDEFVALDRSKIAETLAKKYGANPLKREEEIKNDLLDARCYPAKGGRPSVETSLHNLFQSAYVIHLHPWLVNSVACGRNGKKVMSDLFGDSALWAPYTDPGYTLAKAVENELTIYRKEHGGKDPQYLIIQNHGPFIPANTPAAARRRIEYLFAKIRAFHSAKPKALFGRSRDVVKKSRGALIRHLGSAIRALPAEGDLSKITVFDDSPLVREFVATSAGKRCLLRGPLTPDQIVYCKSFPLWVPCRDGEKPEVVGKRLVQALKRFRARRGYDPRVVAIEGLGLFAVGDTLKAARTVLEVYVDALKIMKHAWAAGGPHFLTAPQCRFIDEWEVEQYRRQVAAENSAEKSGRPRKTTTQEPSTELRALDRRRRRTRGVSALPRTAYAVQLVGPGELRVNTSKEVPRPGPRQVLCRVEAVGLCFSDLKLLEQFAAHSRKSRILSGIDPKALEEIPSYVPGDKPTVPGHEAVVRVVAVGPGAVHKVGLRALVQTDYRWLPTRGSNAAFGYNFEGGLQEYVLMDERVIVSPEGESLLIPVSEELSASAVGLIEPWACVENAYVSPERQTALAGGRMLVVVEEGHRPLGIARTFSPDGPPSRIVVVGKGTETFRIGDLISQNANLNLEKHDSLDAVKGSSFNDIIYFGAKRETIERLDKMPAPRGLLNIVLGSRRVGGPVSIGIGRVHYGGARLVGTVGDDAAESMRTIPATGEIRPGEKALIVGAAGPMGLMHVIRNLCQGVEGVDIVATDFDESRLAMLDARAAPLARDHGLTYRSVNPAKDPHDARSREINASYSVLMVPAPALVAKAVADSLPNGIVNMFAGIPATVSQEINLDAYIAKRLYFIGTSGSVIRDMKIVLEKVNSGRLDTNVSVAAVSGMRGAIDGINAVKNRSIVGKIIVYPMLHNLKLTPLETLRTTHPTVYAKLKNGQWSAEAERELIRVARKTN